MSPVPPSNKGKKLIKINAIAQAQLIKSMLDGVYTCMELAETTADEDELIDKAITAIKEALAQPEQELVTWRNAAIRVGEDLYSVGPFGYYDMTAEQWLDWALSVVTVHAPPTQHGIVTVKYMQSEIKAEREACARVAERSESALHCAAAIRARENT